MLSNEWTVDDTEKAVKRVKDLLAAIPDWWTVDRLSVLERDEQNATTCITICVWYLIWHVHDVEPHIFLYYSITQRSQLRRIFRGLTGILRITLSHSIYWLR